MYFRNYGLRKKCLAKFLKTPVSDQTSTSNIVNGAEHALIRNDSTFTRFIDHCEGNCVRKTLF